MGHSELAVELGGACPESRSQQLTALSLTYVLKISKSMELQCMLQAGGAKEAGDFGAELPYRPTACIGVGRMPQYTRIASGRSRTAAELGAHAARLRLDPMA